MKGSPVRVRASAFCDLLRDFVAWTRALVKGSGVVLERGHLWGRREVTIPIGPVSQVKTDSLTVGLTKDEVAALPALPVQRWAE
jgi:hypothetical protein